MDLIECLDDAPWCVVCPYGSESWCPILADESYRSYLLIRRQAFHQQQSEAEAFRSRLLDILRRHRLPLHYDVLHRILARQVEGVLPSPRAIYAVLARDPNVEAVEPGVYRYRRSQQPRP